MILQNSNGCLRFTIIVFDHVVIINDHVSIVVGLAIEGHATILVANVVVVIAILVVDQFLIDPFPRMNFVIFLPFPFVKRLFLDFF